MLYISTLKFNVLYVNIHLEKIIRYICKLDAYQ